MDRALLMWKSFAAVTPGIVWQNAAALISQ
jgi:hypothetical protein